MGEGTGRIFAANQARGRRVYHYQHRSCARPAARASAITGGGQLNHNIEASGGSNRKRSRTPLLYSLSRRTNPAVDIANF